MSNEQRFSIQKEEGDQPLKLPPDLVNPEENKPESTPESPEEKPQT